MQLFRRRATPAGKGLADELTGFRQELAMVGLFSLVINLLFLTSPIYMLQVYDRVLQSGRVETLVYLTLIAFVALILFGYLHVVRSRMLSRLATWLDAKLSPLVLEAGMAQVAASRDLGGRGLTDLGRVRSFISGVGMTTLMDLPWFPIFALVIWLLHAWLGMVAVVGGLLLFALALANELTTRKAWQGANLASRRDRAFSDVMIRNADVIRAMGMSRSSLGRWGRDHARTLESQGRAEEATGTYLGILKGFRLFLQVAILGVGAYLVILDEITAGAMIAASILLGRALQPIEQSLQAWRSFVDARQGWASLEDLVAATGVLGDKGERTHLPGLEGHLELRGVTWAPPGAPQPIIAEVTFGVPAGRTCGLIGPSGSGKSSLCRLVVGAAKAQLGHVRIDGGDIARWDPEELGAKVGYLPQTVNLFSGTVAQNIARMRDDVEPEWVVRAAKIAGVHDLIMRLPDKYDTEVGEFGERLSGGQRQRIAFARAVFGDPALLVLDEPNAQLDSAGEQALHAALEWLKGQGTTIVLTAHTTSLLRHADVVGMLDGGRIRAFGQRDEVLKWLMDSQRSAKADKPARVSGGTVTPLVAKATPKEE